MAWELWDLGPEATFALRRNRIEGRMVVTWGLGGLWNGDLGTWGLGDLGTWGLGDLGTGTGGLGFQFPLKKVSVRAKKSHGDFDGLRILQLVLIDT